MFFDLAIGKLVASVGGIFGIGSESAVANAPRALRYLLR
jgi:hypothetical protein